MDIAEGKPAPLSPSDRIHLSKMARVEALAALQRMFGERSDLSTRVEVPPPPLYVSVSAGM